MHNRIFRYFRSKHLMAVSIFGVLLVGAVGTNATAAGHHFIKLFTSVFYSDTTSGPVVEGIQNGAGTGVEGVVTTVPGAIGIIGYANNSTVASDIGLEGLVTGNTSVGLLGQSLSTDITGPSIGLEGTSANGVGVVAQTLLNPGGIGLVAKDATATRVAQLGITGGAAVLGNSAGTNILNAGVEGETTDSTTTDITAGGAFGIAGIFGGSSPYYGAAGLGNKYGFAGQTNSTGADTSHRGAGLIGFDVIGPAAGDFNSAVVGQSSHGNGVLAEVSGAVPTGNFGVGTPVGVYTVARSSGGTSGFSIGLSSEAQGLGDLSIAAFNTATGSEVDLEAAGSGGVPGNMISAFGAGSMTLSNAGNMNVSGHLTANGVILALPGSSGVTRATYSPRSAVATVEDVGEGQLQNGQAYIRIDAALSDTMDNRVSYMVFVTPQGDTRGLYVTQKTPAGFFVREIQGGHSSVTFDYRIVAKPVADSSVRLAVMPKQQLPLRMALMHRGARLQPFVAPASGLVGSMRDFRAASEIANSAAQRRLMMARLPHPDKNGTMHMGDVLIKTPRQ